MSNVRNTVQDFISAVKNRSTSVNTYTAVLNADGSVQVGVNGKAVWSKLFWLASGGTVTDANPQGDQVLIHANGTNKGTGDAQVFINSLT